MTNNSREWIIEFSGYSKITALHHNDCWGETRRNFYLVNLKSRSYVGNFDKLHSYFFKLSNSRKKKQQKDIKIQRNLEKFDPTKLEINIIATYSFLPNDKRFPYTRYGPSSRKYLRHIVQGTVEEGVRLSLSGASGPIKISTR